VAGQIRLDPSAAPAPPPPRRASLMPWLALAAALVLVTLGVYAVTSSAPAPAPLATTAGNGKADGSVETIASEVGQAMRHYENAMAELDRLANGNDGQIDPALAKMLQTQLTLSEQAIGESRKALESDPGSQAARDSLFDAFRRKVGVLQAAVTLMNEMRQGNPDGAAKAGSILNKKG
jgi:hypothetical protein